MLLHGLFLSFSGCYRIRTCDLYPVKVILANSIPYYIPLNPFKINTNLANKSFIKGSKIVRIIGRELL